MATQEKTWNVANRLHSMKDSDKPEVNHIIAGADEIYDDTKGAKQSDINAQTDAALADRYTKSETYSKEQLDSLITTPDVNYVTVATFADLPQTGEANTIYRVSSYDGTQVDASKYALYAWNGTAYQLLAVRSAVGEVFDVSEYNSGATYETLTAALAAVPATSKRGGMSIKFILRTNIGTEEAPVYKDEYVRYRLMDTAWSNVVGDWQGVDKEPVYRSRNLVESGGVEATKVDIKCGINLLNPKACIANALVNRTNGKINAVSGAYASDFIPVSQNGLIYNSSSVGIYGGTAVYDKQKNYLRSAGFEYYEYQEGDGYIRTTCRFLTPSWAYCYEGEQVPANHPIEYNPIGGYSAEKYIKGSVDTNAIGDEAVTLRKLGSDIQADIINIREIVGFTFYKEDVSQYYRVPLPYVIKEGTRIHNIGGKISTQTSVSDTASRHDINPGQTYVAQNDIGYISVLYAGLAHFEVYSSFSIEKLAGQLSSEQIEDEAVTSSKIAAGNVNNEHLADETIELEKLSFTTIQTGKNKLNPETVSINKYINRTNGVLTGAPASNNLAATDFIPVSKKGLYCKYAYYGGVAIGHAVYNENKTYIRQSSNPYIYQDGDAYVRFTMHNYNIENAQVEEGSSATAYEPYVGTKVISPDVIPTVSMTDEEFMSKANDNKIFKNEIDVFLPDKVYAVVGDTLQLFFQGMSKCVDIYHYNVVTGCSKGAQYHRYFQYTPNTGDIGTANFNLYIKDNNRNIIGQGNSSIITVNTPTSPSANINVLCIGDSITAGGQWPKEFMRRLTANDGDPVGKNLSNITFVGSMLKNGVHYEGHSGYSWGDYATRGRAAFRFVIPEGTNVTNGNVYSNNGFQYTVIEVSDDNTIRCSTSSFSNIPSSSGTLTKVSGSGDASIPFTNSYDDSQNPFWDADNDKLSFSKYATQYCNGSIDVMYILLGGNALFADTGVTMNHVKNFIDAFHADFPNSKVKLMGMYVPSLILMMPGYGANGSMYADTYNVKCRLKEQAKNYQDFANEENYTSFVEMVDVASQLDSDYNFPVTQKAVNTRNNATEPYANNTLHASPSGGYMQIADAAYRNFVANFCQG